MRIPTFGAKVPAAAAISAGALLAIALPGEAQVSADSPSVGAFRIESPATLQARGAAITAPVSVVCPPGAQAFVSISVSERVGGDIANGGGGAEIDSCTGGFQTVNINVIPQNSPFRKGTAFASGTLFINVGTTQTSDQRDIEIVR